MSFIENYSYYSYLIATAAYLLLLLVSLIGINKNPVAVPLIIAVFSLWFGLVIRLLPFKVMNYSLQKACLLKHYAMPAGTSY